MQSAVSPDSELGRGLLLRNLVMDPIETGVSLLPLGVVTDQRVLNDDPFDIEGADRGVTKEWADRGVTREGAERGVVPKGSNS